MVLAHALLALTIPFTPLSSVSTSAELEQLLRKAGVTRLFVHPSFLERALQAAHAVGVPQDCIYLLEGSSKSCRSLDDFIGATAHVPTVGVRPVTKDTVAYLLFSSGTTGLPKPVVVSHASVCFQIEQNVVVGRIAQGGAKLQVCHLPSLDPLMEFTDHQCRNPCRGRPVWIAYRSTIPTASIRLSFVLLCSR